MLAVRSEGRRTAADMQGLQHGIDFSLAEYRLLERLDIADKTNALGHVGGHFSLEGAAADKGDHRVQVLGVNAKGGFQDFEVLVVLPQRVLEFEAAFVELLRPLRLLLAAEDPAVHVLRFQHEDAVGREEYVVDLRGAVRRVQGDVVQAAVGLLVQLPMSEQAHQQFTDLPFGPWRFEEADQQGRWDQPEQAVYKRAKNKADVHIFFREQSRLSGARYTSEQACRNPDAWHTRIMANCFQSLKRIATIVLWPLGGYARFGGFSQGRVWPTR